MIGKWFWFDLGVCILEKWTKIIKVINKINILTLC